MPRPIALGIVLLAVVACGRDRSDTAVVPDSTAQATTPAATTSQFPSLAVRELSALRDTVTPGGWLRAHPGDSLEIYPPNRDHVADDRWCTRAASLGLGRDSTALRYAYFYPPAPPGDFALPAESPNLIREQCRLGAIWLQTRAFDVRGGILAEAVRDSLAKRYGAGERSLGPDVGFSGSAYWGTIGWWTPGGSIVVSAHDKGMGMGETAERVLAFAYRAGVRFGEPWSSLEAEDAEDQRAMQLTERAARLSGIDSARAVRLLAAFSGAVRAYHTTESGPRARAQAQAAARSLRSPITDWLAASQPLAPAQRAAALVAADQLLGSSAVRYVLANDSGGTEKAVQALGAEFAPDHLGGGNAYLHSLLDSAQRLDRAGPAGRLAMLTWLRIGFNRGMCAGTDSASQRVSAGAAALLKDVTDSADAFELHVLAADGYADIVALAAGAVAEYADSTAYMRAAAEARGHAIQHYRHALLFARQAAPAERRAVWLKGWRLLAGLPPLGVRFYCVYD